jgi:hypothetical protein
LASSEEKVSQPDLLEKESVLSLPLQKGKYSYMTYSKRKSLLTWPPLKRKYRSLTPRKRQCPYNAALKEKICLLGLFELLRAGVLWESYGEPGMLQLLLEDVLAGSQGKSIKQPYGQCLGGSFAFFSTKILLATHLRETTEQKEKGVIWTKEFQNLL